MLKNYKAKDIVHYGLFIAIVYVATRFINIPGPTEGSLFHLGNIVLFTIAIIFGKKAGAISGAFGMALFDITSAYIIWAPFTFVIRFFMGYVLGYMANLGIKNKARNLTMIGLGLLMATLIMVIGYYITEAILFSNIYIPLQAVIGNTVQCIVGIIGAIPLSMMLKPAFKKINGITL